MTAKKKMCEKNVTIRVLVTIAATPNPKGMISNQRWNQCVCSFQDMRMAQPNTLRAAIRLVNV